VQRQLLLPDLLIAMPNEFRFDDLDLREQPASREETADYNSQFGSCNPPPNNTRGCTLNCCTVACP
jgi:hypothetical protein